MTDRERRTTSMFLFTTKEEYLSPFIMELSQSERKSDKIQEYMNLLVTQLDKLVDELSKDNFWTNFPSILGIDAKMLLIIELMSFEEFSDDEIIRIVESDYQSYFKELCGYDLSMETKHSLVFNVS